MAGKAWRRLDIEALRVLVGKAWDPVIVLMAAAIVGYGAFLRLKPLEASGFVPGDFYSWRALGGEWLFGEPSLLLRFFAIAGEGVVVLAPVILWLVGVLAAGYVVYAITGSTASMLISASLLSLSSILLQATSAGNTVWDTPGVAIIPLTVALLAGASRRGSPYLAGIAGMVAGVSSAFWDGYFIVMALIAVYSILEAAAGEWRLALASALATLAFLALSPAAGIAGILLGPGIVIVAALAFAVLASKARLGVVGGLWLLVVAVAFYLLLVAGRVAWEPDMVRVSEGLDRVLSVIQQTPSPLSPESLVRDTSLWLIMALAGALWLAYKGLYGSRGNLYSVSLAILAAAALGGVITLFYTSLPSASLVTLIALSAPLALRAIKDFGLLGDELGIVVAIGLIVSLVIASSYLALNSYERAQLFIPFSVGGQTVMDVEGAEEPSPLPVWNYVAEAIRQLSPERVYTWPQYGSIIEALTGTEATSPDDGYDYLFNSLYILSGSEGEASAVLKQEGVKPGKAVIVVREVFLGRYDARNAVVVMYPRPLVVQSFGTRFFVVQGVGDMNHLYYELTFTRRVDEGTSPFESGWQSEYLLQGYATIMFPGLLGNPAENTARAREAITVKLLLDSIFKISTKGEVLGVCDFIPDNAVYVPGAFIAGPGGGLVQPLFIITETEKFEPYKIIVGCTQILRDTGVAVEFTAEVIGIYVWKG